MSNDGQVSEKFVKSLVDRGDFYGRLADTLLDEGVDWRKRVDAAKRLARYEDRVTRRLSKTTATAAAPASTPSNPINVTGGGYWDGTNLNIAPSDIGQLRVSPTTPQGQNSSSGSGGGAKSRDYYVVINGVLHIQSFNVEGEPGLPPE